MADRSIVITFDATDLVLGAATKQSPSMVVRNLIRGDDILEDRIVLLFEVDHGAEILDGLQAELESRYDADIDVLWDDPDRWRARVTYNRTDALREHPVYGAAPLLGDSVERAVLHFEDGLSVQRFDLREVPDDLEEVLATVRKRAQDADIDCMVRTTSFADDVMGWSPLGNGDNRLPDA